MDQVWATLAAFDTISSWAGNVDHSCLLSDVSEGVGMTRRIQTGRMTLVETVDAWDPPRTVGYRITGLPPAVRKVRNEWNLADQGPYTLATLTTTIDIGPRPPQQGIEKVLAKRLAKDSVRMLEGLAGMHQARAASGRNR